MSEVFVLRRNEIVSWGEVRKYGEEFLGWFFSEVIFDSCSSEGVRYVGVRGRIF